MSKRKLAEYKSEYEKDGGEDVLGDKGSVVNGANDTSSYIVSAGLQLNESQHLVNSNTGHCRC